jgi:hypothetical protein
MFNGVVANDESTLLRASGEIVHLRDDFNIDFESHARLESNTE